MAQSGQKLQASCHFVAPAPELRFASLVGVSYGNFYYEGSMCQVVQSLAVYSVGLAGDIPFYRESIEDQPDGPVWSEAPGELPFRVQHQNPGLESLVRASYGGFYSEDNMYQAVQFLAV